MARKVLLDAGLIGLGCSPAAPSFAAFESWLEGSTTDGTDVLIPDVTRFEVRRELLRLRATAKLRQLDRFCDQFAAAPATAEAWDRAGEFWALVRQAGKPTAAPDALDGDAILAGIAATIGQPEDEVIVASTNVVHLGRFPEVDARSWENIP